MIQRGERNRRGNLVPDTNILGHGGPPSAKRFRKPANRGPAGKGKDGKAVVPFAARLRFRNLRDARRKARVLSQISHTTEKP
jgi:hypothetical protein